MAPKIIAKGPRTIQPKNIAVIPHTIEAMLIPFPFPAIGDNKFEDSETFDIVSVLAFVVLFTGKDAYEIA